MCLLCYLISRIRMLDRVKLKILNIEEYFIDATFEKTYIPEVGADIKFEYKNFKGTYIFRNSSVLLEGSLHKFYKHGENYDDFTYKQVKEAFKIIAKKFNKELKDIEITFVELGVNLIMTSLPEHYINCFKALGRNIFIYMTPLSGSSKFTGKRCKSSLYDFKVYNKSADTKAKTITKAKPEGNILRIEIALTSNFLRNNKLIFNAEQLKNIRIFRKYIRILVRAFMTSNKINIYSSKDLVGFSDKEVKDYYFLTSDQYDLYIQHLKEAGRSLKNEIARRKKLELKLKSLHISNDYVNEMTNEFTSKRKELME